MALKLPYLTGANRGVLEILTEGETCFTVLPGDHIALAAKLRELKDDPRERERVAQNAYELYRNKFTPGVIARNMLAGLS